MTEDFVRYVKNYCLKAIAKMHKDATRRLSTATWRTSTGMIIPFKGALCHTLFAIYKSSHQLNSKNNSQVFVIEDYI